MIFDSSARHGPKSNLPSYGAGGVLVRPDRQRDHVRGLQAQLNSVDRHAQQLGLRGRYTGTSGCVTPAGAKFSLPITLNIYNATDRTQLLTSKTQQFDISYRPSANPAKCPDAPTKWYSTTEKTCFNGLAQDVTFTFDGTTTLPDTVRYGITYGTSHHGSTPIGDQDCSSTSAGCFYDSLNVAVTDAATSVGTEHGHAEAQRGWNRRQCPRQLRTRPPCSSRRVAEAELSTRNHSQGGLPLAGPLRSVGPVLRDV